MRPRTARLVEILAVVAGAAIALGLTSVAHPVGSSCSGGGAGPTTTGPFPYEFTSIVPLASGPDHWYNATWITGAGVQFSGVSFQILTPQGTVVHPATDWNITVENGSETLGVYDWNPAGIGSWSSGSANAFQGTSTLALFSAATNLSGDAWLVQLHASYPVGCSVQGSVARGIP